VTLIPYAGSGDRRKTKKFESLALLSLRTEFNALARKYKAAEAENDKLRMRLSVALERAADLERLINRAASILDGPRVDCETLPFAAEANKVVLAVADHCRVPPMGIFGRARTTEYTVPRHIAMFIVHEDLGASVAAVGRFFGGRDPTTVIHAVKKVKQTSERYQSAADDIREIRLKLKSAPSGALAATPPPSSPVGSRVAALSSGGDT
jgi:hypothetical protein